LRTASSSSRASAASRPPSSALYSAFSDHTSELTSRCVGVRTQADVCSPLCLPAHTQGRETERRAHVSLRVGRYTARNSDEEADCRRPSCASSSSSSSSPAGQQHAHERGAGSHQAMAQGDGGEGGSWERFVEVMGALDEGAALDREMLRLVRWVWQSCHSFPPSFPPLHSLRCGCSGSHSL
jgi:hypothetical protein